MDVTPAGVRTSGRTAIEVEGLPTALALAPGARDTAFLTVHNRTPIIDEVDIFVDGLLPGWYSLSAPRLRLRPHESAELTLDFHPPAESPPLAGPYPASLRVRSRAAALGAPLGAATSLPFMFEVLPQEDLPAGGLEVALVPQVVTTKSVGSFEIELATYGNHEVVVDLSISDDAKALVAHLPVDRLSIAPGEKRRVSAAVRLRRRPFFAATIETPFSVFVHPAGDDLAAPVVESAGTLVYKGPFAFAPGLLRGAVGWLVLGIVAVVAILALYLLVAPLLQEPAPTPAPAVETPVASAPAEPTAATPAAAATPSEAEPPADLSALPAELLSEPSTAATPAATTTPAAPAAAVPADPSSIEATVSAAVAATVQARAAEAPAAAPAPGPTRTPALPRSL